MANEDKNLWVVLIQKSPKGPLSESEIKALLEKGVIKTTDLGYQVSSEAGQHDMGWKFLWQFDAFNRRKNRKEGPVKTEPPAERRVAKPVQDPPTNPDTLPQDLMNITPEDLLPRANRSVALDGNKALEDWEEENPSPKAKWDLGLTPRSLAWLSGEVALTFVLYFVVSLGTGPQISTTVTESNPTPGDTNDAAAPEVQPTKTSESASAEGSVDSPPAQTQTRIETTGRAIGRIPRKVKLPPGLNRLPTQVFSRPSGSAPSARPLSPTESEAEVVESNLDKDGPMDFGEGDEAVRSQDSARGNEESESKNGSKKIARPNRPLASEEEESLTEPSDDDPPETQDNASDE